MVEGSNSGLKGNFANIQQESFRVFKLTKINVLLAFTIAGYNFEVIRSFNASTAATEAAAARNKRMRAKRRRGTWGEILSVVPTSSGPDPPPK